MKFFNLKKLVQGSMYASQLSWEQQEAVINWFDELGADLNTINVDDFVVNGTIFLSRDEYNEMTEEKKEEPRILLDDGSDDLFVLSY